MTDKRELKITINWDKLSKYKFKNLEIGCTYGDNDISILKKFEYKLPSDFGNFKLINRFYEAVKHNTYTDIVRYKLDRFITINKHRYLDYQKYILKDLKEIYLKGKKLVIASFIMVSIVPLTAGLISSNMTNNTIKLTKLNCAVDTTNLGLDDDIISKIFDKEDIVIKKDKKVTKKVFMDTITEKSEVKSFTKTIKKSIHAGSKAIVKYKVGSTVDLYSNDKSFWNTIANDVKSGTFVGTFKSSKFSVSKEEQTRRIKVVYNYFKKIEDDFQINALVATAQFMVESNCGQSNLSNGGNNFFGIKEFRKDFPFLRAHDDGNNLDETGKSRFRKYYSPEDGLLDYCGFIGKSLYENCRLYYKDSDKYIYNLQHLKWDKKEKQWIRYADNNGYERMLKGKVKYIKELVK